MGCDGYCVCGAPYNYNELSRSYEYGCDDQDHIELIKDLQQEITLLTTKLNLSNKTGNHMVSYQNKLDSGTKVVVHSFGDGKAGIGEVAGIAYDDGYFRSYIIKLIDNPWQYEYPCISVPQGCLNILEE